MKGLAFRFLPGILGFALVAAAQGQTDSRASFEAASSYPILLVLTASVAAAAALILNMDPMSWRHRSAAALLQTDTRAA